MKPSCLCYWMRFLMAKESYEFKIYINFRGKNVKQLAETQT